MDEINNMSVKDAATDYVQKYGFSVIPVNGPKSMRPKAALVPWEQYQNRTATVEEIERWYSTYPDAGVAIITGRVSGVVVLDIDGPEGEASIQGRTLPWTPTVKTGKGTHYFFKHPGSEVKNKAGLLDHVDIRGDGGYVVAAPSWHENGNQYRWLVGLDEAELAPLPDWLLELIKSSGPARVTTPGPTAGMAQDLSEVFVNGVSEGQRNDAATRLAGHYIAKGLGDDEVVRILLDWNKRNRPPLGEDEIEQVVASIRGADDEGLALLALPGSDLKETTRGYTIMGNGNKKLVTNFTIRLEEDIKIIGGLVEEREFRGKLLVKRQTLPFQIKAGDFQDNKKLAKALSEQAGAGIVFDPRELNRIRNAITVNSSPIQTRIYSQFGYIDGGEYLSPSLAIKSGVIRENLDKKIEMNDESARCLDFKQISDQEFDQVTRHIKADLLGLSPHFVTYPVLAHIHLAPVFARLGRVEKYSLWITGTTGFGKSFLARLAQNFYGPFNSPSSLTTWGSTPNAIQKRGHFFKDSLYVVDDYKLANLHNKPGALQILQNYSDGTGRSRLRSDSSSQPTYSIQGQLLCTGEDLPETEASVLARSLVVQMPITIKNYERGNRCLEMQGFYPGYIAKFIAWSQLISEELIKEKIEILQESFIDGIQGQQNDTRIAYNLGLNFLGFDLAMRFWKDKGIIDATEADATHKEMADILFEIRGRQLRLTKDEQASELFRSTLQELILSDRLSVEGYLPGFGESSRAGKKVGFVKSIQGQADHLCIHPEIAMAEVNDALKRSGKALPLSKEAIAQQLINDGLIIEQDEGRTTRQVRLDGKKSRVWVFKLETFGIENPELSPLSPHTTTSGDTSGSSANPCGDW